MSELVQLSVATWNVLADSYVRPGWFPAADVDLLQPGARTHDMLRIAAELDVDVLALQEVEHPVAQALAAELVNYDVRWCPKGRGRPEGCVTAVRAGWVVLEEECLEFQDGEPVSGHVAHILVLSRGTARVRLVNTHVRFDTSPAPAHIGVRQVRGVLSQVRQEEVTVVAGDVNDQPGGPVRGALMAAGLMPVHGDEPSSTFAGSQVRALDVVAVRGAAAQPVATGLRVADALPTRQCPSDHVPLVATIEWNV